MFLPEIKDEMKLSIFDTDASTSFRRRTGSLNKDSLPLGRERKIRYPCGNVEPLFNQPNGTPDMLNRLRENKICLETAYPCKVQSNITGTVRVVNLDFHKKVFVRYTFNDWYSFQESEATYISGSSHGSTDAFSFEIDISPLIGKLDKSLILCLNYQCLGQDFWDNNNGTNYSFQYIYIPTRRRASISAHCRFATSLNVTE